MSRQRATINWDKSFYLTAEQVGLLGLEDQSVNELKLQDGHTPSMAAVADSARVANALVANALNTLTTADLKRWKEHLDL